VRVLAIDGGGIRGLIPALVLAEVERRTERPVADLFDLIAGTSTGGILACGLTLAGAGGRPRYAAEELVDLYERDGPRIFHRDLVKRITSAGGWIDERYDDDGLNDALRRALGDARLKDALTPVMITAYDIEGRFAFFFRSQRARRDPAYDFALWEAARATSAAPTYFEPYRLTDAAGARTYSLIDGGVFATNPAMCAYVDAAQEGPVQLLASLGTGSHTRPYRHDDARGWGQIEWARPLIDIVFDGIADTIDFQLDALLPRAAFRLQAELADASDAMDDASPPNLRALRATAERLIAERSREIDDLCERLT